MKANAEPFINFGSKEDSHHGPSRYYLVLPGTVEVRQITGTATSLIGNYPYTTIMKHDFWSVT